MIVGDHTRDRDEYGDYEEREPPLGEEERESKEKAPKMSGMSRGERVADASEEPIVQEAVSDRLMRAEAVEHGFQNVNGETRRELDERNPDDYSGGRSESSVQGEGASQGEHGEAGCVDG